MVVRILPQFSGKCVMWLLDISEIDSELAVDACLKGAGGMAGNHYFHTGFPHEFHRQGLRIPHLEMWVIIIAVKLWSSKYRGKIIKVCTDNEAVAVIVNNGRSNDPYLQSQLRAHVVAHKG